MDSFARPPAVRCRGGARPSRRNAADPHGLPIKTCRRNWCAPFSRRPVRIVCAAPGEACLAPTMAGVGRQCLPEIAPQGHFLALRAQGATAPLGPRNDKSGSLPLNVQKAPRVRRSDCRKSLAEFAPAGAKKMEIIFSGGVYVGENTARLANVRRACPSCAEASRSPFQTRAQ